MAKVTPWFPPEVKPIHLGWYDVRLNDSILRAKWDGQDWRAQVFFGGKFFKWGIQSLHWRGLASKPK